MIPAWTAPGSREQVRQGAVAQQIHVLDAVRPGGHPGDQAPDLQIRVDAAVAARADVLGGQVRQAGAGRKGHHRDQPGVRHERRVVKARLDLRQLMQQSHLRGVLSS